MRESELPDAPICLEYHYHEAKPVFFGHYWQTGTPRIFAPHAACLDVSVAKGGDLTTYRWSGEHALTDENLVWVSGLKPSATPSVDEDE